MRKIITFASISILVILVAGFTVETPVSRPSAAAVRIDVSVPGKGTVSMPYAKPVRIDVGVTGEAPVGFNRVSVNLKSEERAKALWQKSFGTLDGYSFEKANTISYVVEEETVPCACHIEAEPYEYLYRTKEQGGPTCIDTCGFLPQ